MTDLATTNAVGSAGEQTAPAGYAASRLNALRHGILSQFTVLPWEEAAEYEALLSALVYEHRPRGPTEEHLVEEMAGVLWRKRRLRLAEAATYHRGLQSATDTLEKTVRAALVLADHPKLKVDVACSVTSTAEEISTELAELDADEAATQRAIAILSNGSAESYEAALAAVHESTAEAWAEQLTWKAEDYDSETAPYSPTPDDLKRYLEVAILPWYEERRQELAAYPRVRAQALGEALDPDKLERLGRYEVHLDRKLERTLSTLLRLQELRKGATAPGD